MVEQNAQVQEVTTVSTPTTQRVVRQTKVVTPTGSSQKEYKTKKVIFRTYQIIWYILGVIEVILAFRVVFKLLGANPLSGFTSFIYGVSDPLALPFSGILRVTATSGSVFEWSTLIAMIVYAIVAYGMAALFQLVKPTTPTEVEETIENP